MLVGRTEQPAESLWRLACSRGVIAIALRTSLVVGTLLNLINQGPLLLDDWAALHGLPVLLNYLVPYAVATHAAAQALVRRRTAR